MEPVSYRILKQESGMKVRKCGRMEAKYVHTSIPPDFHPRTELAEFVSFVLCPFQNVRSKVIRQSEGQRNHCEGRIGASRR